LAKILTFDIETAGVNALRSDLGFVLMFGYKWAHESEARIITIKRRELRQFNDKPLLEKASKLLEEADLTVAHYGSVFDRRFIQGRLLINNLPAIPNTKMRDTCMIARSVANFSSNRLKNLGKTLKLKHQKMDNNWPRAWFRAMQGDMKAIKALAEYCKGDVLATEELYFRLRPFDNPHPRIVWDDRASCPVDGEAVEYRGFAFVGVNKYRRYVCTKCGKWSRESRAA
jgi:uncharacterized protein YprB with RNaseH-like and TPR domain